MGSPVCTGVFFPVLAGHRYVFYNGVAMRVVFIGTPTFALPVLEGLLNSPYQVVGVYTTPDQLRGRGRRPAASPVKTYAMSRGLPIFQPSSLRSLEIQEQFKGLSPDIAVVAAYGRIIPAELLAVPPRGMINIHPSMLPLYRGPSPVVSAILEGEIATGVTLMLVEPKVDAGPILAQRSTAIGTGERADSLTERLFRMGADLLLEILPAWQEECLQCRPQDPAVATYTKMIRREDGLVQWESSAEDLCRQLRAYTPWPGLYTYWAGRQLKILNARPGDQGARGDAGKVVLLKNNGTALGIVTGQGVLILETLQLEGGRPVNASQFLNGHPGFPESQLPS